MRAYQAQVLQKVKAIRDALVSEVGNITGLKEAKEAADIENIRLKKEVERLNYRVHILLKSLKEEEEKNSRA